LNGDIAQQEDERNWKMNAMAIVLGLSILPRTLALSRGSRTSVVTTFLSLDGRDGQRHVLGTEPAPCLRH
jgi:hypothetical protein